MQSGVGGSRPRCYSGGQGRPRYPGDGVSIDNRMTTTAIIVVVGIIIIIIIVIIMIAFVIIYAVISESFHFLQV